MRPETLALTLTKRLGLTSPDAVTVETRSACAAFWVWTTHPVAAGPWSR